MPISLDHLDKIIAESEQHVLEMTIHVKATDEGAIHAPAARRTLRAFESILFEYRHARRAKIEDVRRLQAIRGDRPSSFFLQSTRSGQYLTPGNDHLS